MHEMRRLAEIAAFLQAEGFRRERGDVFATLLLGDAQGQWACHVRDGLHRISVLATMGRTMLPILIRGGDNPAIVRRSDVDSWTHVRDGLYRREEALQVFDRLIAGT